MVQRQETVKSEYLNDCIDNIVQVPIHSFIYVYPENGLQELQELGGSAIKDATVYVVNALENAKRMCAFVCGVP